MVRHGVIIVHVTVTFLTDEHLSVFLSIEDLIDFVRVDIGSGRWWSREASSARKGFKRGVGMSRSTWERLRSCPALQSRR